MTWPIKKDEVDPPRQQQGSIFVPRLQKLVLDALSEVFDTNREDNTTGIFIEIGSTYHYAIVTVVKDASEPATLIATFEHDEVTFQTDEMGLIDKVQEVMGRLEPEANYTEVPPEDEEVKD